MGPGGGAGAFLRVSFGVPPLETPSQTKNQGSLKVYVIKMLTRWYGISRPLQYSTIQYNV